MSSCMSGGISNVVLPQEALLFLQLSCTAVLIRSTLRLVMLQSQNPTTYHSRTAFLNTVHFDTMQATVVCARAGVFAVSVMPILHAQAAMRSFSTCLTGSGPPPAHSLPVVPQRYSDLALTSVVDGKHGMAYLQSLPRLSRLQLACSPASKKPPGRCCTNSAKTRS